MATEGSSCVKGCGRLTQQLVATCVTRRGFMFQSDQVHYRTEPKSLVKSHVSSLCQALCWRKLGVFAAHVLACAGRVLCRAWVRANVSVRRRIHRACPVGVVAATYTLPTPSSPALENL